MISQARVWKILRAGRQGFTLIEIMVVVAIMAIVMTIAIPSIYRQLNPESMQQAVRDILEACREARAHAVLQGAPTELVISPVDRQIRAPNFSARLSEKLVIEMLDVNFVEYKNDDVARVVFRENGTCDEFTIVLRSEKNEWRKITLEVVTGMPDVDTDPDRWR